MVAADLKVATELDAESAASGCDVHDRRERRLHDHDYHRRKRELHDHDHGGSGVHERGDGCHGWDREQRERR